MKAVIFDFNGTMLFDSPKHDMAWRKFLADFIGRTISEEELSAYVYGRNNLFVLEHFTQRSITPEEADKLGEDKERIYRKLCLEDKENFHLAKGLPIFLDILSVCDIPRTIATMSGKGNLDMYFKYLHLDRWFRWEDIIYDNGSLPGKPDPTVYIKAMEKIGTAPTDCIIFEDSISGIQAAYAAGAGEIIAVANTEKAELLETLPGVKHVISDFSGVFHLLRGELS
jgi:beta-phosphoglucomutase-like phosphatase (HAD superfamily)